MRGRLFVMVVLVVAGALVAALNWEAMARGVTLDLLFVTVTTTTAALVAVVAATLIVLFLLAALLDRSRHLQQLSQLERQLDDARAEVDRKRSAELQDLAAELAERIDAARSGIDGGLAGLEDRLESRLQDVHGDLGTRLEALRERVVVVRDELAADIAEVEDALLRDRTPALPAEMERDDEA